MDIAFEVWHRKISMRKFVNLINGLPRESAWIRYISDDDKDSKRTLASYDLDNIHL